VGLFLFSSDSSVPAQITYQGRTYSGLVKVTTIEVQAHIGALHPTGKTIDGKTVFVSAGARPLVVALQLSGGDYDAYQLTG